MKHIGDGVLKCPECGGIYNINDCISNIFERLIGDLKWI